MKFPELYKKKPPRKSKPGGFNFLGGRRPHPARPVLLCACMNRRNKHACQDIRNERCKGPGHLHGQEPPVVDLDGISFLHKQDAVERERTQKSADHRPEEPDDRIAETGFDPAGDLPHVVQRTGRSQRHRSADVDREERGVVNDEHDDRTDQEVPGKRVQQYGKQGWIEIHSHGGPSSSWECTRQNLAQQYNKSSKCLHTRKPLTLRLGVRGDERGIGRK
jgi:hypothetical protein